MEKYSETIIINEGKYTDEEKKWMEDLCKRKCQELQSIYVIYRPNCGCPIEQTVLLDRYPMSEKIMIRCDECKKGCLTEISDPIIFHLPLTKQDFTLEQFKELVFFEYGNQKEYIEKYRSL